MGKSNTTNSGDETNVLPVMNIAVVYLTLIGIGAIGGYLVFYSMFQARCSRLLTENSYSCSQSQSEMQAKYLKALGDLRNCEEVADAKSEMYLLQGKLQAQAQLNEKHQALLEKHESTLVRIAELQESQMGSAAVIQTLKDEIHSTSEQLMRSTRETEEAKAERDNTLKKLQEGMATSYRSPEVRAQEATEMEFMEQSIKSKEAVLRRFGNPPYTVEIVLTFLNSYNPFPIEITLTDLDDTPQAVWAFLNLLNDGLYNNMNVVALGANFIRGGDPSEAGGDKLLSTFIEVTNGLNLLTTVNPSRTCRRFCFCFDVQGPAFAIYMNNAATGRLCPGKVTAGRSKLSKMKPNQQALIISTKIKETETLSNDEL